MQLYMYIRVYVIPEAQCIYATKRVKNHETVTRVCMRCADIEKQERAMGLIESGFVWCGVYARGNQAGRVCSKVF